MRLSERGEERAEGSARRAPAATFAARIKSETPPHKKKEYTHHERRVRRHCRGRLPVRMGHTQSWRGFASCRRAARRADGPIRHQVYDDGVPADLVLPRSDDHLQARPRRHGDRSRTDGAGLVGACGCRGSGRVRGAGGELSRKLRTLAASETVAVRRARASAFGNTRREDVGVALLSHPVPRWALTHRQSHPHGGGWVERHGGWCLLLLGVFARCCVAVKRGKALPRGGRTGTREWRRPAPCFTNHQTLARPRGRRCRRFLFSPTPMAPPHPPPRWRIRVATNAQSDHLFVLPPDTPVSHLRGESYVLWWTEGPHARRVRVVTGNAGGWLAEAALRTASLRL